jgi:hypothetical protein
MPSPIFFILEAISHWKRMRVFTPSDSDVEVILPPYSGPTPTSPVYLFLGSSSQAFLPSRVEEIFSNLRLDHAPMHFPTLSEEMKGIIETIL